jgi:hypothetical protein
MRCPECNALLEEGLLPVGHGMHWVRGRKPGGGGAFAEDVPGTHAVMRPNRMEAWRCKKCHLILFRYGQSWEANKKAQMRQEAEAAPADASDGGGGDGA